MSYNLVFHIPVTFPPLLPGEIHLWCARLISNASLENYFQSILSLGERNRADAFYHDHERERYIISHGYLRILLGKYVHQAPGELDICQTGQGKPFLGSQAVEFNLSHSGEVAIFAFSRDGAVGVDVETLRMVPEARDIIRRIFSARELWMYSLAPKHKKVKVFLQLWTRGEALVKAVGSGFGDNVGAISHDEVMKEGKSFRISSFIPTPGYVGAVAAPEKFLKISCREVVDDLLPPTF